MSNTASAGIGIRVIDADTFISRAFGLLCRSRLRPGEALHLNPCNAIHTVGMRYAIDLVFLDGDGAIVRISPSVGLFRFRRCARAKSVLEMLSGEANRLGLRQGMKLGAFDTHN